MVFDFLLNKVTLDHELASYKATHFRSYSLLTTCLSTNLKTHCAERLTKPLAFKCKKIMTRVEICKSCKCIHQH